MPYTYVTKSQNLNLIVKVHAWLLPDSFIKKVARRGDQLLENKILKPYWITSWELDCSVIANRLLLRPSHISINNRYNQANYDVKLATVLQFKK